jgi:hypothetical protein
MFLCPISKNNLACNICAISTPFTYNLFALTCFLYLLYLDCCLPYDRSSNSCICHGLLVYLIRNPMINLLTCILVSPNFETGKKRVRKKNCQDNGLMSNIWIVQSHFMWDIIITNNGEFPS